MVERKKYALFDLAHAYRAAWHAGENKPMGFAQSKSLEQLSRVREREYDKVICLVDAPPYIRSTMFNEYKAHREDPGAVFHEQYEELQEQLRTQGYPVWKCDGYEADDLAASFVAQAEWELLDIYTNDKDLLQLIDDSKRVTVVWVSVGTRMDETAVTKLRWGTKGSLGIKASQVGDLLALMGDKADNIPGCPGVGAARAAALLEKNDLTSLYAGIKDGLTPQDVGPKVLASLRDNMAQVLHSRSMVALLDDAPLPLDELKGRQLVSEDEGIERAAIQDEPRMVLTAELESVLDNPPEPTEELKELMKTPRTEIVPAVEAPVVQRQVNEMSVADLVTRVKKVKDVQRAVMVQGTHFGTVPGVNKPTLLKPGAEMLGMAFQLDPQFTLEKERDGDHLTVTATCIVYHQPTGKRLGSGVGECSSKESRYAWRKGERKCPECDKPSIFKDKREGGYYCWRKKGGCGATFPRGEKSIESQNAERTPNPDLYDQHNTVIKMAIKRAHVAAILFVTCASEIFTQDVEDMPGGYGQ